jgi:tRNA (mo5U34)-methyltransferase
VQPQRGEWQLKIDQIWHQAVKFETELKANKKAAEPEDFPWYPYGSLSNFEILNRLLKDQYRDFDFLAGDKPIVDIGAADGDTCFTLESAGYQVYAVDNAPTNYNSCRGIKSLIQVRQSSVQLLEVDLDSQFRLPDVEFSFAFFLGILYHLKNPWFVLESLAKKVRYAVLSTRIARFNLPPDKASTRAGINESRVGVRTVPMAYLLDADECNNDATNFWIFSEAGLLRILHRTGWDVVQYMTLGNTQTSEPAHGAGDERAFCLIRSRHFD